MLLKRLCIRYRAWKCQFFSVLQMWANAYVEYRTINEEEMRTKITERDLSEDQLKPHQTDRLYLEVKILAYIPQRRTHTRGSVC